MSGKWIFLSLFWTIVNADNIKFLECEPPDKPIGGDYGPKQPTYNPGDSIYYFCEVDTFIGGNYLRKCEETGNWTGDTPFCDAPSAFLSMNQTSTLNYLSKAEYAADGRRDTCSSTEGRGGDEWIGVFLKPGQFVRVMIFLPKGHASFQVVLVKGNGEEVVCGTKTQNIGRYDWTIQNCPWLNNMGATGIKIKSLSDDPLQICEIQAYVLTSPTCADPHVNIENGHLSLNRQKAVLTCNRGYLRSQHTQMNCIREGVWDRKDLFCSETMWEEADPVTTAQ